MRFFKWHSDFNNNLLHKFDKIIIFKCLTSRASFGRVLNESAIF